MSKKAGKSLKEKRADKHAKTESRNQVQQTLPDKKR
jgi:hypothetical protein